MRHQIARNVQLFNVKYIAYSTTMSNLAEGEFGIFPEGSETSIASTIVFATLPSKFTIISKLGGKVYTSFATIAKDKIIAANYKEYSAEVVNVWETIVKHCDCVSGFKIKLNLDEQSLIQRDGLTWTHSDFIVGVTADEIACHCTEGTFPAYDNNVITKMAVEKIIASESPFYTAEAKADITGYTTYADQAALTTANGTPDKADGALITGTGLVQYDGTAWVTVGTIEGVITDLEGFVNINKEINKDGTASTDIYLTLVIKGIEQKAGIYRDLEVNYINPRGVRLSPSIEVNESVNIAFTETQDLGFEVGAGYDMRAEEFEYLSQYTKLNHYPQLSDGIAAGELVYQFENNKNYDTVTFEFTTDKVNKNDGDKRLFGIILGAETGSSEATDLEDIFIA